MLCFVCLITLSACSQTSRSEEKTITDKNEKTDDIFDIDKKIENSGFYTYVQLYTYESPILWGFLLLAQAFVGVRVQTVGQ